MPVSFLPPPLENATYSLGIYEAKSGKLVRRLQEIAPESAFTVGLNGLMTSWDGKDDAGKAVLPGHYAARGYAVGPIRIEGTNVLDNDWATSDEDLRIHHVESIAFIPEDNGLGVLATMADGSVEMLRLSGKDFKLMWKQHVDSPPKGMSLELLSVGKHLDVFDELKARLSGVMPTPLVACRMDTGEVVEKHALEKALPTITSDGGAQEAIASVPGKHAPFSWAGREGISWQVSDLGIVQIARNGEVLRKLEILPGDPLPQAVSAALDEDRIYLLEEKEGWQRVRGLAWVDAKVENGKAVSTWQTFFERNIRTASPVPTLENSSTTEIILVDNPLVPSKLQKAKLRASYDEKGSYLALADGLRLRKVSEQANLKAAGLVKSKTANVLAFYQYDEAAWDEFSIDGANNMMAFDAGEFEMTADGEKAHTEKTAEPLDL